MKLKRLMLTIGLWCTRGATKRGNYLRKHHVFAHVGENVRYQIRTIPLYPELISIGSNVNISSGTQLITHDAIHLVYNQMPDAKEKLKEKVGCIEIGNNVFIGADAIILGNVCIGSNVIVSAGAYVNKDLQSGGIYGGIPAHKIGDFDVLWKKRASTTYPSVKHNQLISNTEIEEAWSIFRKERSKLSG